MNGDRLSAGQHDMESHVPQDAKTGQFAKMKFRFQRMLFVGSLYFKTAGTNHPNENQLESVNKQFGLACSPQALLLPAACATLLWKGFDINQVVQQYQHDQITLQQLTRELLAYAPNWLQYGDKTAIASDVKAIFDSLVAA